MTYYELCAQIQSILQLTVRGKVFKPNKGKVLSLNRDLDQYIECVRWYLSFKPTSKQKHHKDAYKKAKELFELKTALLQSARDKAVELYKSFKNIKKKGSQFHLRKCCIRFDARSFSFVKADKDISSYCFHLSLSGSYGRTAFPNHLRGKKGAHRGGITRGVFD
ncbi:MAG: hypothetical protein GF317_01355 [Candidatus Lokiarchaeota archaeon]|nr:hypothetical protein [Candidatus Lokiarchaeota archaeon]MBD3198591.1 hypothetical protein [Candidatus Lokiarchaeota archaeon]